MCDVSGIYKCTVDCSGGYERGVGGAAGPEVRCPSEQRGVALRSQCRPQLAL